MGLLLAQYTITGFDASAHVSEETVGARTEAPKAIVRAIYVSAIAAFFLNLAMTAALPKKGAVDASGADIYAGIVFGNANDPFLVNAAPRLISFSVGHRQWPSSWCSSASSPSSSAAWRRSPPTAA